METFSSFLKSFHHQSCCFPYPSKAYSHHFCFYLQLPFEAINPMLLKIDVFSCSQIFLCRGSQGGKKLQFFVFVKLHFIIFFVITEGGGISTKDSHFQLAKESPPPHFTQNFSGAFARDSSSYQRAFFQAVYFPQAGDEYK